MVVVNIPLTSTHRSSIPVHLMLYVVLGVRVSIVTSIPVDTVNTELLVDSLRTVHVKFPLASRSLKVTSLADSEVRYSVLTST